MRSTVPIDNDLVGSMWIWKASVSTFDDDLMPQVFLIVSMDGSYPVYLSRSGKFHKSSVLWMSWTSQKDRERIL